MCFYYKYYNYVPLVFGAENKRHCIIYIVYSIANVFCVSLRIWLCIYGTTRSLFPTRNVNRIDRTEACLAAFVVSVQRNRFCTMGAFSWQKSPVKILFARKVQDGRAKRPHSGTLRREQNSPNSGTLLSASQTFPLTGESPRPTLKILFRA